MDANVVLDLQTLFALSGNLIRWLTCETFEEFY